MLVFGQVIQQKIQYDAKYKLSEEPLAFSIDTVFFFKLDTRK